MKKPKALKKASGRTGNQIQKLATKRTKNTISKRNARLRRDPEFKTQFEARRKAYLERIST